jgi:hypothetical protein
MTSAPRNHLWSNTRCSDRSIRVLEVVSYLTPQLSCERHRNMGKISLGRDD